MSAVGDRLSLCRVIGTLPKNVLLVNALLLILFLSETYGGRVHDLRIAETTPSRLGVDCCRIWASCRARSLR